MTMRYHGEGDWRRIASDHGFDVKTDIGVQMSGAAPMRAPRISTGFVVLRKFKFLSGWIPTDPGVWYDWVHGPALISRPSFNDTPQAQLDAFRASGGDLTAFAPDPMGQPTTPGPAIPNTGIMGRVQASRPFANGNGFAIQELRYFAIRGISDIVIRRLK